MSPYQVIEEHALCGGTVCSPKGGFDHVIGLWTLWWTKMLNLRQIKQVLNF